MTTLAESSLRIGGMHSAACADTIEHVLLGLPEREDQNGDFEVGDFQQPTNQIVIVSLIYFAGNLICTNPQVNGKFTALTS